MLSPFASNYIDFIIPFLINNCKQLKQENTNPFLYIMLYNPTLADPQLNKQDLSAVIFTCFQNVKFITLFLLLAVVDSSNQRNLTKIVLQTHQYTIHSTLLRFGLNCRIPCHSKTHLESVATRLRSYTARMLSG